MPTDESYWSQESIETDRALEVRFLETAKSMFTFLQLQSTPVAGIGH